MLIERSFAEDTGAGKNADAKHSQIALLEDSKTIAPPRTASDGSAAPMHSDVHEVVEDAGGKTTTMALQTLSAGDHTLQTKDGREFIVHIPVVDSANEKLPVMFVFSGSAHGNFKIKDFVPESGMNRFADAPEHKFIAVYPLPKKHHLGEGSSAPAFGWNTLDPAGGTLINRRDSKKAGYDDLDFVKKIADLLPQVANVDPSHKDWAAVGFSQGGVFLNYVVNKVPHLFPTTGLVGSAMQTDYKYDVKAGNAENVAIVNLRADEKTLPFKGHEDMRFHLESILHAVLPNSRFEKLNDLAAINNLKSDPGKQMNFYEQRLGAKNSETIQFSTPLNSESKDTETLLHSKAPDTNRTVAIFDLPTALHSYPEPDPSGARTNGGIKYTEFDTNKQIVDLWMSYNKTLK